MHSVKNYIRQCFELALQAEGRTSPNPMVGAIVVGKDGQVVGTGFHPRAGEPHAEVYALTEAGEKAKGATIYVSLEPCCHHGKTPPCTDRIISSGIKRVVAAMKDPNPKVEGGGFKQLKEAGIEVVSDVLASEAQWLNRAFVKAVTTGVPWVVLKIASTLDGKIADRFGKSQWITGEESRKFVHRLRNHLDCVLIGAATARMDNPRLNVRDVEDPRDPVRAVVDSKLSIDPISHLFDKSTGGSTIIYCSPEALAEKKGHFPATAEFVPIGTANGASKDACAVDFRDLRSILKDLKTRGVNSVLCEGGGRLAASLLEEDLIDEIFWITAPAILGDNQGKAAIESRRTVSIDELKRFHFMESMQLGDDTMVRLVKKPEVQSDAAAGLSKIYGKRGRKTKTW